MEGTISINRSYTEALFTPFNSDESPIKIAGKDQIGRVFTGDRVFLLDETKKPRFKLLESKPLLLVGRLLLTSTQRFSGNRYQFQPIDAHYPTFLVATKIPVSRGDQYVLVTFLSWIDNLPYGAIKQLIGPVGCYDSEAQVRMHYRQVYFPKLKLSSSNMLDLCKDSSKVLDLCHLEVYSVDPPNCQDIDDAFSCQEKNQLFELQIHIADVSFFLSDQLTLDQLVRRPNSIYLPHKVNHMLPETLATNLISLIPAQKRLAQTLSLVIDQTGDIMQSQLQRTVIQSRKAWSYDQAQKARHRNATLNLAYRISQLLAQKYLNHLYPNTQLWDFHQVIEVLMIITNHRVALMLPQNGLFRVNAVDGLIEADNIPTELQKIRRKIHSSAAVYQITAGTHSALGLSHYTHFTSPLRRLADILVHLQLYSLIQNDQVLRDYIAQINTFQRHSRQLQRDLNLLRLVFEDHPEEATAFILDIKDFVATVYLSQIDLIIDHHLIDEAVQQFFGIEPIPNGVIIINHEKRQRTEVRLNQAYHIRLFYHPNNAFTRKISLQFDFSQNF
jgi:exoribonuclease R